MKNYIFSKDDVLQTELSHRIIGGKAKGFSLFRSHPKWIPDFFVLSSEFIADFQNIKNAALGEAQLFQEVTSLIQAKSLSDFIFESKSLLIRSSAENESLENRGEHDSFKCISSPEHVARLITKIYLDWDRSVHSKQALSLIIQHAVNVKAKGHLSNERRVSQLNRDWLVDYEFIETKYTQENRRFKIFRNRYQEDFIIPDKLIATKFESIYKQLHHPAELITLNSKELRVHFEWVWDGSEVWIVQSDLASNKVEAIDPNVFIESDSTKKCKPLLSFKILKDVKSVNVQCFNKTKHQTLFNQAGMETTDLWVIDAGVFFDKGSEKHKALIYELDLLISNGPIVIRTDLDETKYNLQQRQNLPRSNSLLTLQDTTQFIDDTLLSLKINKQKSKEICFIVHSYIPSLSSAFCFADPTNPRVRIDSIWGLPDGLQYYAHDSFEVNVKTKQTLKEKKRYKGFMLGANLNADGQWTPAEVDKPYDWRASINKSSRNEIAAETFKLSKFLKKPVVVMWFIKTPEGSLHPENVPWYMEEKEIVDFSIEKRDSVYSRNLLKITNYEGITRAREAHLNGVHFNSVMLYPEEKIIRDNDFLKAVADLCKELSVGIVFFGSILQHAFYQLRKEGVEVSCFEPFTPQKETFEYNKLVRDKIPARIAQDGELPVVIQCSDEDYIEKLEEKILEEANELAGASSIQDRTEEIADLLEVIEAICEKEEITIKEILKAKKEKFLKSGGFKEGLVLLSSESKPAIDVEKAFQTKKTKKATTNKERKSQETHTIQLELKLKTRNDY